MTGEDEDGTHLMLRSALEGIAATIHDHSGHVVHYAGDAVLAEFSTVVDALESAVAIQHKVTATNADVDPGRRVQFRIGVNLGDVIVDRDDIYGDGVNVAARLESLADTGGICISESVRVAIGSRLQLEYRFIGAQKVKNISEPVRAYHVLFDQPFLELASQELFEQEVKFHTTPDGVSLAYSSMGAGKPLVRAGMWVNHLEYEMQSALWASWWQELAQSYSLVRYDQRGNGLSDRQVDEISFDRFVDDLESLLLHMGLKDIALLGISQGCGISVALAQRRPDLVSHLILYGGYTQGWRSRGDAEIIAEAEAQSVLMRHGWGQDNPAYRQMFCAMFRPDATTEQVSAFIEQQQIAVSAENAVRCHEAFGEFDVSDMLPKLTIPTLVMHCREDARAPFEEGRRFAARIPNARFVSLEGRNHLLAPGDVCWERFFREIRDFVLT